MNHQANSFECHDGNEHWRWRYRCAEDIAVRCVAECFGVGAVYLIGSVKNATAGPMSDIDLVIHFRGSAGQRENLASWLKERDAELSRINSVRTGCLTESMLDLHFITDEEIKNRTGFAVHIGAVSDAAKLLKSADMQHS
jgi:predicted nucleotidyltransferase